MKMQKKLIFCLIFSTVGYVTTCPYEFTNDSTKPILLVETVAETLFVQPSQTVTVDAPMSQDEEATLPLQKRGNGHAAIFVYKEGAGNRFALEYKITEEACGKGTQLSYSDLAPMAAGQKDSGRMGIKKITPERRERKVQKLKEKALKKN